MDGSVAFFFSIWCYFLERLLAQGDLEKGNQKERYLITKDTDIYIYIFFFSKKNQEH